MTRRVNVIFCLELFLFFSIKSQDFDDDSTLPNGYFTNEWVVRVTGNTTDINNIARKFGFSNRGIVRFR